jgi:hypothetical protein
MMMMMGDRQAGDCWIVGGDIPFYSQGLLLNLCVHFQQLCIYRLITRNCFSISFLLVCFDSVVFLGG